MKKTNFLLAVVAIILLSAIILRVQQLRNNSHEPVNEELVEENEIEKEEEEASIDYTEPEEEAIKIIQPLENELVSSPLKIKGMIPANWLLEANYYVVLSDNEDKSIIDVSQIETEYEWDTMETVAFFSILEFSDLSGQGIISIREMKDNSLIYVDEAEEIFINYISE